MNECRDGRKEGLIVLDWRLAAGGWRGRKKVKGRSR